MKRRVLSLVIVGLMACTLFALPAIADDQQTQQLTDQTTSGNTEVDAKITDGAGEVAYIVTIPEKIDFGTLVCPETDVDDNAIQKFIVKCEKMQGVSKIDVSVCNEGSVKGEANQIFYLTNMTNASCSFKPVYDLYVGVNEGNKKIDVTQAMPANGFDYVAFSKEGQEVTGGVVLNQRQLFSYKDNLASIAGSYSGNMVFTIAAK